MTVRTDQITSIPKESLRGLEILKGSILQRCSEDKYDVLLDEPLNSETTILAWVPESAIAATE
ncbi:MAG: hypothetical protein WD533_07670 [Dehalococcoidia bacterium]